MNYLLLMWATDDMSGGTEADYQAWMTYEQERGVAVVRGRSEIRPPTDLQAAGSAERCVLS